MLAQSARKPRRAPTLQSVHIPAPVGGLNTVDPALALPELDCLKLYNLTAAEFGLRVRLGYKEWCTGLTGATDSTVRTTMPFAGSDTNGGTDKLFACTQAGIWDCTTSSASPAQLVTFGTQTGGAGYGTFCVFPTPAGHFLLYCDEENGLFIYTETTDSWAPGLSGVTQLWTTNTGYLIGNKVVNGGKAYICTAAGTSAGSGGPTGTGSGITDGTVTWDYVRTLQTWFASTAYLVDDTVINGEKLYICTTAGTSAASGGPTGTGTGIADNTAVWDYVSPHAANSTNIGPSLADQQAGFTADPTSFVAVAGWKNRLWLVERNSTRAWYLSTNAVYGTATSFDFGSKMRTGGTLSNLYDWSYDAGNGMDALLVGIGTSGDVVIYQGTDPNSASTFGLKGSWSVGGVPSGRRIATDYGGELLIMSLLGIVPLSRLVVGQPVVAGDRSSYATDKIANDFNRLASTYQTNQGWAIGLHPQDNALLVLVPTVSGTPATPYAMSFGKRSWSVYRDLPILSIGVWNGTTYFGTPDGRVCQSSGYLDGVTLAEPIAFSPIAWSALLAYRNGDTPKQKRVHWLKVLLETQEPTPAINAEAKYDLDLSEASAPVGIGINADGTWDNSVWDSSTWGGDYSPYAPIIGATGMGSAIAIAVRGLASSRTSFVGVDVQFDVAGSVL